MILTEEEKKEYLINYKPKPKWHTKLALFSTVAFVTMLFFFMLNYLGYMSLGLSDYLILLCTSVLGTIFGYMLTTLFRR